MRPRATLLDRFWSKVERRGDDECWPWLAGTRHDGCGQFFFEGRPHPAPRIVWMLTHGEIPESNVFVCHKCDNPPCVNPNHLFLGTPADTNAHSREDRAGNGMTDTIHPEFDARRACDIGDYVDLIWANASRRAVAASPSSPVGSGPSGLPSLSQDNREPAQPNKRAGRNHG